MDGILKYVRGTKPVREKCSIPNASVAASICLMLWKYWLPRLQWKKSLIQFPEFQYTQIYVLRLFLKRWYDPDGQLQCNAVTGPCLTIYKKGWLVPIIWLLGPIHIIKQTQGISFVLNDSPSVPKSFLSITKVLHSICLKLRSGHGTMTFHNYVGRWPISHTPYGRLDFDHTKLESYILCIPPVYNGFNQIWVDHSIR